jgi:hypothetical protein
MAGAFLARSVCVKDCNTGIEPIELSRRNVCAR